MEMIQQLDAKIILWIQEHVVCDGLNAPMLLISKMGNAGWFWILLGILLLLWGIRNRKFARYGHTSSSFAAATAIYAMNRKWGIVAYVFAVLMGISRLYLGVHFPTDVLAGAVIGFVMAKLTLWVLGKINASFQFQNR